MPVHKAVIHAEIGLHARPAAEFVRAVTATGLPVTIGRPGQRSVDARSLLEVMTEDFERGCEVELAVDSGRIPEGRTTEDAQAALSRLVALLAAQ